MGPSCQKKIAPILIFASAATLPLLLAMLYPGYVLGKEICQGIAMSTLGVHDSGCAWSESRDFYYFILFGTATLYFMYCCAVARPLSWLLKRGSIHCQLLLALFFTLPGFGLYAFLGQLSNKLWPPSTGIIAVAILAPIFLRKPAQILLGRTNCGDAQREIETNQEERQPVWEALSQLFLDTETNLPAIAQRCAESIYSLAELEEIFFQEVFPALRANIQSPAGEWAGFDSVWLKNRILQHHTRGKWLQPLLSKSFARKAWAELEPLIQRARAT